MADDNAHIAGPGRPARPAGSTVIEMAGPAKSFGGKVAVEDLSFQVRSGQVTGFLGLNGAGTSPARRLMRQEARRTTFDGRPNRELAEPAQEVGAMLESGAFHPTRTARNHLRRMAAPCAVPTSGSMRSLTSSGSRPSRARAPGATRWAGASDSAWQSRCSGTATTSCAGTEHDAPNARSAQ